MPGAQDFVTRGNKAADQAAGVASHSTIMIQAVMVLPDGAPTLEDIIRMQCVRLQDCGEHVMG